jgi:hypothetical protein
MASMQSGVHSLSFEFLPWGMLLHARWRLSGWRAHGAKSHGFFTSHTASSLSHVDEAAADALAGRAPLEVGQPTHHTHPYLVRACCPIPLSFLSCTVRTRAYPSLSTRRALSSMRA